MVRPRFSLRALMAVVVVASVMIASLRYATEAWAGAVLLGLQAVLGLAILGVVYRRGARRAFWLGFALFGWGYLFQIVKTGEDLFPSRSQGIAGFGFTNGGFGQADQPSRHVLSSFLDALYPFIHRSSGPDPQPSFLHWFSSSVAVNPAIEEALDRPISMPFGTEAPIEDVLKYIKSATQSAQLPGGIPIYVEPAGLQEAERTMQSMIRLELEGVPLRTTLKLALRQLDLKYEVEGGLLRITYIGARQATDDRMAFRRIGHCHFALMAGLLGGLMGWAFHATGSRALPVPRA